MGAVSQMVRRASTALPSAGRLVNRRDAKNAEIPALLVFSALFASLWLKRRNFFGGRSAAPRSSRLCCSAWLNGSLQVSPVKAAVVTADSVAQGDASTHRDGGSADRTPVGQVRRSLHHKIAVGRAGKQKREIGLANGYVWR